MPYPTLGGYFRIMKFSNFFKKPVIKQPGHLYVAASAVHGRGVFSHKHITAGEHIETAPLIPISSNEDELLKNTALYHYYFLVKDENIKVVIGLGCSSIYNHRAPSNAMYSINLDKLTIGIKAVTAIKAGEEIFINYNGRHDDYSPVNF